MVCWTGKLGKSLLSTGPYFPKVYMGINSFIDLLCKDLGNLLVRRPQYQCLQD